MAYNYIHDINVHGTQYDMRCEKAQNTHYASSAHWLVNDDDSTYHFSVENASSAIPIYDKNTTIVYNKDVRMIDPTFDTEDTVLRNVGVQTQIVNRSNDVLFTMFDTQPNYTVNHGSNSWNTYQSASEYMGTYNYGGLSNGSARIPFRFSACLYRKNSTVTTPDFDGKIPLAKITKIRGVDVKDLFVKGPAYILGTCLIRRATQNAQQGYPNTTFRGNSREMFFWMDTDENSDTYCYIYLCNSNCKNGVNGQSAYHCSYTVTQCRNLPCIELSFNTVLYVLHM